MNLLNYNIFWIDSLSDCTFTTFSSCSTSSGSLNRDSLDSYTSIDDENGPRETSLTNSSLTNTRLSDTCLTGTKDSLATSPNSSEISSKNSEVAITHTINKNPSSTPSSSIDSTPEDSRTTSTISIEAVHNSRPQSLQDSESIDCDRVIGGQAKQICRSKLVYLDKVSNDCVRYAPTTPTENTPTDNIASSSPNSGIYEYEVNESERALFDDFEDYGESVVFSRRSPTEESLEVRGVAGELLNGSTTKTRQSIDIDDAVLKSRQFIVDERVKMRRADLRSTEHTTTPSKVVPANSFPATLTSYSEHISSSSSEILAISDAIDEMSIVKEVHVNISTLDDNCGSDGSNDEVEVESNSSPVLLVNL